MLHTIRSLSAIACIGMVAACVPAGPTAPPSSDTEETLTMATITGKLAYRERIALTPGHTLTVTLSDTSVADRRALAIAETSRVLDDEQVPLAFELSADMSKLTPRNRYTVRGTLTGPDGKLAWTTDTAHTIDPELAEQDLGTLIMVKVPAP